MPFFSSKNKRITTKIVLLSFFIFIAIFFTLFQDKEHFCTKSFIETTSDYAKHNGYVIADYHNISSQNIPFSIYNQIKMLKFKLLNNSKLNTYTYTLNSESKKCRIIISAICAGDHVKFIVIKHSQLSHSSIHDLKTYFKQKTGYHHIECIQIK